MSTSDDTNEPKKKKLGYKSPPKHSQFRKGSSGNPRGRKKWRPPERLSDPYDVLPRLMAEKVTMTINGKKRTLPICEAMWLSTGLKAASGNLAATKMILEMIKQAPLAATDPDVYTIRITEQDHVMMRQFMRDAIAFGADEEASKEVAREYGIDPDKDDGPTNEPRSPEDRRH